MSLQRGTTAALSLRLLKISPTLGLALALAPALALALATATTDRARYTHWLPRQGTNAAVKQFLYGGEPDLVVFESRLQRMCMATDAARPASAGPRLCPLFDSGGTASGTCSTR